jgi:raffinose/stachyose/melibiose transport system substrate-binding protein
MAAEFTGAISHGCVRRCRTRHWGVNTAPGCWQDDVDTRDGNLQTVRWILGLVLLVFATLAAFAAIDDEQRVALVIGNGDYQHVSPLPNPGNDARALSEKLRALDFEVTTAIDMTRADLEETVLRFGAESEGADIVLIFYAGHGLQVDGENYLLATDARIDDRNDLSEAAIEEGRLHSVFAFVEPRLSLLIMDACRTNPFADVLGTAPGLASGGAAEHELGSARSNENLLIVFSAAPGQVALDGDSGNSPFTTALLQWIDQPGLEIESIFRHVRRTVIDLTGGQIPWVESSMTDEAWLRPAIAAAPRASLSDLLGQALAGFEDPLEKQAAEAYLRRLLPEADVFAEQRLAASGAIATDAAAEIPALRWLSIRRSEDPSAFTAFVEEYPDSPFAALAVDRLAALADMAGAEASDEAGPEMASGGPAAEAPTPRDEAALAATEAAFALDRDARIAVQRLLAEAGHYRGTLDGAIGPMSRTALAAFQEAAQLPGTGYLDATTLDRLIAEAAPSLLSGELAPPDRAAIHGLAAVARGGPGAQPVPIRVASITRHPDVHALWRDLADAFEAENPGTMVTFDLRSDTEYKAQLLAMLGAENPPDILFTWGGGHLRALAEAGFAADLTETMAEGWAVTFKPGSLGTLTIDGRIHAVPAQMSLFNLWANGRLLAEAGVDPASLATWEGLLAAVPKLKAAGVNPIGVGGADRWPLQGYWAGLVLGLGGREGLDAALAGEGGGFEAAPFVEAGVRLKELADLEPFQPNYRDLTNTEATRAFIGQWSAMTLTGNWAYAEMSRHWPGGLEAAAEELIRIPFPPSDLGAGGADLTYGGSDGWALATDAPPEAFAFLERLASLETQTALAGMGYVVPSIAGADAAISVPTIRAVADELTATGHHQLFLDQLLGPQVGERLNDAVVAIVDGDLSPQGAAAELERAWAEVRVTAFPAEAQPDPALEVVP